METHMLLIYKTLMSSQMYSLSDGIAFLFGENWGTEVTLAKALQVREQFVTQLESWDSHLYSLKPLNNPVVLVGL